jgi:hypothetical protein
MHQAKKRNQWSFRVKAHVDIDSRTKLVRAAVTMVADTTESIVVDGW